MVFSYNNKKWTKVGLEIFSILLLYKPTQWAQGVGIYKNLEKQTGKCHILRVYDTKQPMHWKRESFGWEK